MRWGVKKKSNDELRQRFVNLTVAQAKAINLTLPDPDLAYDEATENWKFGAIDWDEFWRVVKGDGPCNRERLAARNKAHDEGEWVARGRGDATYAARSATQPTHGGPSRRLDEHGQTNVRARRRTPTTSGRCGKSSCSRRRATPHEHAGSVHAADAEQALQNARDVYARRGEAVSIWVVPSARDHRVDARRHGAVLRSRATTRRTGIRSSTRCRAAFASLTRVVAR